MKTSGKFCIAAAIAMLGYFLCPRPASANETETVVETAETSYAFPGMHFSTEYVTEEYEYDDAYAIRYTDPDANMDEVEILVDLETYQIVQKAISEKSDVVGRLVLNDDYTTDNMEVYTIIP